MNMILTRGPVTKDGVFGEFFTEDGEKFCSTLERVYEQDDGSLAPKIPVGTYTARRRLSPKFGYEVFELVDVPGHDFIEIHRANWQRQLDGCIAVGEEADPPMLMRSESAFDRFMALQAGSGSITIVIK